MEVIAYSFVVGLLKADEQKPEILIKLDLGWHFRNLKVCGDVENCRKKFLLEQNSKRKRNFKA